MACPDHEGKQKIMVCVPCKTVVCDQCIEDSHYEHQLKTFETAAKTVISDLMTLAESTCFTTLEKDIKDFSEIRQREGEHALMTKQELLERRDQLKQVLDQVTELAVTKLDQHNENLFKELDEVKDKAIQQSQKFRNFKDEVGRLQTSHNYLEVVEHGWKLKTPEITPLEFSKLSRLMFMPEMPVNTPNIEMLFGELVQQDLYAPTTFHPDDTFSTQVLGHYKSNPFSPDSSICTPDLFGDGPEGATSTQIHPAGPTDVSTQLKLSLNTQSLKCEVKLTHKRSFKLPSSARVMQPTVEGDCWIRCVGYFNTIKLVSKNGDVIKDVPLTTRVFGILPLSVTNQVLLACPDKKCIEQLVPMKSDVATSIRFHTVPLKPYYMCGTSNGDILVTMTYQTSLSADCNSTSVLVKYNSKGRELARVHQDGHGQDLFFVHHSINTSNTGTVAVVNYTDTDPYASHLVVLDDKLNLTHRYIFHGVTVPAEDQLPELTGQFCISDVLFNQLSLFLISEWYSKTVQLLDPMCNLLKVLVTAHQAPPRALALHADGDLWVGLHDGTVQVYKHTCDFTSEET